MKMGSQIEVSPEKARRLKRLRTLSSKPVGKIFLILLSSVVGLLILQLISTAIIANHIYKGRSFPNLQVANVSSGGKTYSQISENLNSKLGESKATLIVDENSKSFDLAQLGISLNTAELEKISLKRDIKRLLTPLFLRDVRKLPLRVDLDELNQNVSKAYENAGFKAYTNASFTVEKGRLITKPGKEGIGIEDESLMRALQEHYQATLDALQYSTRKTEVEPTVSESDINANESEILAFVKLNYAITDGKEELQAREAEKASWLSVQKKDNQVVVETNEKQIKNFVAKAMEKFERSVKNQTTTKYLSGRQSTTIQGANGREVTNADEVESALFAAVNEKRSYQGSFEFKTIPFAKESRTVDDRANIKVYTYEVVKWGNVQSNLEEFASLAAQTYADSRGWSKGDIVFKQVANGGNFTLVLSEASRVGSFSPGCSSYYSCNVGRYVIINDDRWRGATPPWNAAGGSLRDYRHMVVNHETGHWLGFGHRYCSGAGQRAPVMQQQSISLQGCVFNAWPTQAEISSL